MKKQPKGSSTILPAKQSMALASEVGTDLQSPAAGVEALNSLATRELVALLQVSDAIAITDNLEDILFQATTLAARLTEAEYAAIGIITDTVLDFQVQVGLRDTKTRQVPISQGITGWVARHSLAQNVGDVEKDPRFIRPTRNSRFKSELGVPIVAQGLVLGVIDVETSKQNAFTPHHQYLLEELGKRIAVSISNARRTKRQARRLLNEVQFLKQLQDIDIKLSKRILDVDSILQAILERAVIATNASAGQFILLEGSTLVVRQDIGVTPSGVGRTLSAADQGLVPMACRHRHAIMVNDTHEPFATSLYKDAEGMRSALAIPIVAGDECLGVLNLESAHTGAFTQSHLELVQHLAQRASIAVGFANKIQSLLRVSQAAAGINTTTLDAVLDKIYSGLHELMPVTEAAVFLRSAHDPDVLEYLPGASYRAGGHWTKMRSVRIGRGVVGRAVDTRTTTVEPDVSRLTDPLHVNLIPSTRTSVGFPLINPQGRVIGGFLVESPVPSAFSIEDIRVLEIFAGFASTALSNYLFLAELESAWRALDVAYQQRVATASLTVLGEITGNLIHRIGNDIGSAHEEIKDLLRLQRNKAATRKGLLIAKRNTGDVLKLVGQLLRRIGDTTQLTIEDLSLPEAVREGLRVYGSLPSNIALSLKVARSTARVRSTGVLPLVIAEMIRNSAKAIGRQQGKIRISAFEQGDRVRLSVWNSGSTVPQESIPFVFDFLYHRTSGNRRAGIGFGLWWARSVLRAQGGDIQLVYSEASRGTEFQLALLRGESDLPLSGEAPGEL